MARQVVILALVLFAIVGLSAAVAPSTSPEASPSNDVIGTTDPGSAPGPGTDDDTEAGTIGAPVPEGVFPETPEEAPGASTKSSAGVTKVSAAAGVVAAIVAVFF